MALDTNINFIGIGAQKCASTWVYKILEDHPEVCVSDKKELDFFSYKYDHGFQWYLKNFSKCTNEICGEISPSYFYDPLAPGRVFEYNPSAKIIITLRDPIDRAYSNHLHEIRIGRYLSEDLSFEEGLKNNPMYLYQSLYATHISKWLKCFKMDQVLILIQEEIKVDPCLHAKKVYEFLDIDINHQSAFLNRQANVSFSEKFKGVEYIFKVTGSLLRKIGLDLIVNLLKENKTIYQLRQKNRRHLTFEVPPMKQETKNQLSRDFEDEVSRLKSIMGRSNLPWEVST